MTYSLMMPLLSKQIGWHHPPATHQLLREGGKGRALSAWVCTQTAWAMAAWQNPILPGMETASTIIQAWKTPQGISAHPPAHIRVSNEARPGCSVPYSSESFKLLRMQQIASLGHLLQGSAVLTGKHCFLVSSLTSFYNLRPLCQL